MACDERAIRIRKSGNHRGHGDAREAPISIQPASTGRIDKGSRSWQACRDSEGDMLPDETRLMVRIEYVSDNGTRTFRLDRIINLDNIHGGCVTMDGNGDQCLPN